MRPDPTPKGRKGRLMMKIIIKIFFLINMPFPLLGRGLALPSLGVVWTFLLLGLGLSSFV